MFVITSFAPDTWHPSGGERLSVIVLLSKGFRVELPVWFEIGSLVVLVLILIADLALIIKRPHIPSTKEATLWVVFYVSLAMVFAVLLGVFADWNWAGLFVQGWALEYSLSIDNLFVFILIMTQFKVPKKYQQEVLMVGIIIALVLRGIFILLGAALIEQFSFVFYIFGLFLIWTAWRQAFGGEDHDDEEKENKILGFFRKRGKVTEGYHGNKLRVGPKGSRMFTPMLIVFIAIGLTDLLFAIDSIPAIFGITTNPFIVFTANLFALMGLRQLYFLLGGLMDRLRYLHYGIAFLLFFIGVKLVIHAMAENELPFINGGKHIEWVPHFPDWISFPVIALSMGIATIASLLATRKERKAGVISAEQAEIDEEIPEDTRAVADVHGDDVTVRSVDSLIQRDSNSDGK